MPDSAARERERRGDVVAVADVREPATLERAEVLAQREQVGERLARVRDVGEQVDDRDVDRVGHALEHLVVEHARRDHRAHARERAGDVLGGLAVVDARPPRRAGRSGGRRASRPPSRSTPACAPTASGSSATTLWPASTRRHRVGRRPSTPRRGRGRAASAPGSRSSTSRKSRRHRRWPLASTVGEDRDRLVDLGVGDEQRRREPQRAVGVTALTTRPASRHRCATSLASMPARELGREQQARAPRTATTPGELRSASASRAPARRRARGNVLALHHVEHRERGARRERLAAERRGVVAGPERRRRPRRAPSTRRSARRCRAPWPS